VLAAPHHNRHPVCRVHVAKIEFSLGPYLSYPVGQNRRVKFDRLAWRIQDEGETIATFGAARLIKKLDGKMELLGGSQETATLFTNRAHSFFA
jgi:hypothetical protein